ncbi:MAG: hypothetical protein ACKVTZ_08590 [Bacteroidia bacterium]
MKKLTYVFSTCFLLGLVWFGQGCGGRLHNGITDCVPKEYFEVLGAKLLSVQKWIPANNTTTASFPSDIWEEAHLFSQDEQLEILLQFEVSFFSTSQSEIRQKNTRPFEFSLFPKAYADKISPTPCANLDGKRGTPDKIKTFEILTIEDFDENHPANSSINEYFSKQTAVNEGVPLNDWLQNVAYAQSLNTAFMDGFYIGAHILRLNVLPTYQKIHQFKLHITFEDGRVSVLTLPKMYFNQ